MVMRSVRRRLPAPERSPPCAFVARATRGLSGVDGGVLVWLSHATLVLKLSPGGRCTTEAFGLAEPGFLFFCSLPLRNGAAEIESQFHLAGSVYNPRRALSTVIFS